MLLPQAIPFIIGIAVLLIVGVLTAGKSFSANDVAEIGVALGGIFIAIVLVMFVVGWSCDNIQVVEKFLVEDASAELNSLWSEIGDVEKTVCTYITQADNFIKSAVGQPGADNPSLVTQAQQKAIAEAGGPITDCSASWVTVSIDEAENRVSRIETTLNGFTGPQFESTYNKTVPCTESFVDMSGNEQLKKRIDGLKERLTKIKTVAATQKKKYLDPINQKTEQLKKGQASDCDKKRGASTAVKAANVSQSDVPT
jgi:hypothetical protein